MKFSEIACIVKLYCNLTFYFLKFFPKMAAKIQIHRNSHYKYWIWPKASRIHFRPSTFQIQIGQGICKYEMYLNGQEIDDSACEEYACDETCKNFQ